MLMFVDMKKGCESCDMIASRLHIDGRKAESVHEGKSRAESGQIVSKFQDVRIGIMIATDAGAWGIDVKDMKYVINYDFPGSLDEYIYGIDHCESDGTKGTAYTFFTVAHARFAKPLTILLKEARQIVLNWQHWGVMYPIQEELTYAWTVAWRRLTGGKKGLELVISPECICIVKRLICLPNLPWTMSKRERINMFV